MISQETTVRHRWSSIVEGQNRDSNTAKTRNFTIVWSQVSAHYFWPGAKDFIDNWVCSCQKCAELNTLSQGYVKTPLMPIETSSCFDMICYDLAAPFFQKRLKDTSCIDHS